MRSIGRKRMLMEEEEQEKEDSKEREQEGRGGRGDGAVCETQQEAWETKGEENAQEREDMLDEEQGKH